MMQRLLVWLPVLLSAADDRSSFARAAEPGMGAPPMGAAPSRPTRAQLNSAALCLISRGSNIDDHHSGGGGGAETPCLTSVGAQDMLQYFAGLVEDDVARVACPLASVASAHVRLRQVNELCCASFDHHTGACRVQDSCTTSCAAALMSVYSNCMNLLDGWISSSTPAIGRFVEQCRAVDSHDGAVMGARRLQGTRDNTANKADPRQVTQLPFSAQNKNRALAMSCVRLPLCPQFVPHVPHQVVKTGCHSGGLTPLPRVRKASKCTLTCEQGFEEIHPVVGSCSISANGTASYQGQSVTCKPETLPDGSFSAVYCRVEANSVLRQHCAKMKPTQPTKCTITCAEAWLPLWSSCSSSLREFRSVTAKCESTAQTLLMASPSTITISGLICHSYANGRYHLRPHTVAAKSSWAFTTQDSRVLLLTFRESPDRWCLAEGTESAACFAQFISYEPEPPWHTVSWLEECVGRSQVDRLTLTPGFTSNDCKQALKLVTQEVDQFCCAGPHKCRIGSAKGTAPKRCNYDCARIWVPFETDCHDYLRKTRRSQFDAFTNQCSKTFANMKVIKKVGSVYANTVHSQFHATFVASKDLMYRIVMRPDKALTLSTVQVVAPHSHHIMASRFDYTLHGAGVKSLEWAATEDESGVDITVTALSGGGNFELETTIAGSVLHLAPELITFRYDKQRQQRGVSLQTHCIFFDDCTYRYAGEEVQGSGNAFFLRLRGVAGLTYDFGVELEKVGLVSTGTHFNVGVFHENAVGGTDSAEQINASDFALGPWTAAGKTTYAQLHNCKGDADTLSRVPCGGDESDVGDFRVHPGEGPFQANSSFEWPCPATGTYFVQVTANCDVPYYSDTSRCSKQADGEMKCRLKSDYQCTSEARLRVDVRDTSTTISVHGILSVNSAVLTPGSEAEAQLAQMFTMSQHPAISYVTEIQAVHPGSCSTNPCLHRGHCTDVTETNAQMAELFPASTIASAPMFHCQCTPMWVGVRCEQSAELAAGRHTQASTSKVSYARVVVHAQGQTHGLAAKHIHRLRSQLASSGLAGNTPGWNTSPNNGGHRRILQDDSNTIAALKDELAAARAELAICRDQRTTNSNVTDAADGHDLSGLESARAGRALQANSPMAAYIPKTGTAMICPVAQCALLPCLNGGTCTEYKNVHPAALQDPKLVGFGCSCKPGWSGATCSEKKVCRRPSELYGYNLQEINLALSSFSVTATCAAGYAGRATVTPCPSADKEYGLSGCAQMCTSPSNAHEGNYAVSETSLVWGSRFAVTASCQPGSRGTATVRMCPLPNSPYTLSGCRRAADVDPMCAAEAIVKTLTGSWRAISTGKGHHCDRSSQNDGGDDPDHFGDSSPVKKHIVRFDLPGGENSLALHRSRGGKCGTDAGGWLSGWPGPHVTGSWTDSAKYGGPARSFDKSGFTFPPTGTSTQATVCFDDGVGPCDFHMAIRVANCGDHYRFLLPPVPYCSGGAGLAYCAAHVPKPISTKVLESPWHWTRGYKGVRITSDGSLAETAPSHTCCYRPVVCGEPMHATGNYYAEFQVLHSKTNGVMVGIAQAAFDPTKSIHSGQYVYGAYATPNGWMMELPSMNFYHNYLSKGKALPWVDGKQQAVLAGQTIGLRLKSGSLSVYINSALVGVICNGLHGDFVFAADLSISDVRSIRIVPTPTKDSSEPSYSCPAGAVAPVAAVGGRPYCGGMVGECVGPGGSDLNRKFQNGGQVHTKAACRAACNAETACVGFAYGVSGAFVGYCRIYGQGVAQHATKPWMFNIHPAITIGGVDNNLHYVCVAVASRNTNSKPHADCSKLLASSNAACGQHAAGKHVPARCNSKCKPAFEAWHDAGCIKRVAFPKAVKAELVQFYKLCRDYCGAHGTWQSETSTCKCDPGFTGGICNFHNGRQCCNTCCPPHVFTPHAKSGGSNCYCWNPEPHVAHRCDAGCD